MIYISTLNNLKQFFKKESSIDAFRNILIIIIPSFFVFYWTNISMGIAFSVGIILAALTDIPGNLKDKKITALICIPAFFIASLVTSYSLLNAPWLVILILAVFGFLCNLTLVLGPRIGTIGNLTLIIISFTLGLRPENAIPYTLSLTAGAIVFFSVSLLQVWLFPFRSLKHAMNDGFENMSNLLRLKISCYDDNTPLEQAYKNLSTFHIKVSEQLDTVRTLLLREDYINKSALSQDAGWINKTYRLIDLYELLMANDYDYEVVRMKLGRNNALPIIRTILVYLADQTAQIRHNNSKYLAKTDDKIQSGIDQLIQINKNSSLEDAKIVNSILDHITHIQSIIKLAVANDVNQDTTWISHKKYKSFITSQSSLASIKKHLNKKSPIFLYSVRISLLITVAGLLGYFLPEFRYASWIILTIILVARPSYSITVKRNYQRIVGSILGLIISIIVLYFIQDIIALLVISAVSLYLFYLFNKPNYLTCVVFITITIIISLNLYEGNIFSLLGSRFAFTILGSLFAILGCIVIPINHLKTVESVSTNLINSYKKYLEALNDSLLSNTIDYYQLRLVRKNAQTSLAQFYDAIEQFIKDPSYKQKDRKTIDHFETVAYRINALLIGMSISIAKSHTLEEKTIFYNNISTINSLIREMHQIACGVTLPKK